uniref:Uncharacterized protein TCIL3000_11_8290 n=1 Tax=Trypanosoma congolense (strain IL3000) TaxID=1068625 RepID=G0V158_TRYCI|nr:unnamed protein product [Trypanosoma congolense IL3000]
METEQQQQRPLCTKDLEKALDYVVTFGGSHRDGEPLPLFRYIFDLKERVMGCITSHDDVRKLVESDTGKRVTDGIVKFLDADGDGSVSPRDFQAIYEGKLKSTIRENSDTLDKIIPYFGQCAVGLITGYTMGRVVRRVYARKFLILTTGVMMYTGVQFLMQKNFIQQQMLLSLLKQKSKELADFDGDGVVGVDDLSHLVDSQMRLVSTQLGIGGVAPGVLGYGALAAGLRRGLRRV